MHRYPIISMRKFPPPSRSHHFLHNGTTFHHPLVSPLPPPQIAPATTAFDRTTSRLLYSSPSPAVVVESSSDFASLSLIACLLILSFVSLFFIINLRIKSRLLPHLQNFNSLWTVRLLLVFFAAFWALNQILRLPFFLHRTNNTFPLLTPLTLDQQTIMCKVHVVLSLGFFEPGFLVTLLFLVNVSVKKTNPSRLWAVAAVVGACSPILLLQMILVFFKPLEIKTDRILMHPSSIDSMDSDGNKFAICTYPTFSCFVFGAFAVAYSFAFLISCWKVVAFVINKTISNRINMLAISVMVALPAQIICLCVLLVTVPGGDIHGCAIFAMFLSFSCCVAVGEIILIIKPIADSLAAVVGDYSLYGSDFRAETRRWEDGG